MGIDQGANRPERVTVRNALLRSWPTCRESSSCATGRPSIPPERLLRAQLLQIFYSIRSELLLIEQLDYNLLFRWFVGLTMDDSVWDATNAIRLTRYSTSLATWRI